MFLYFNSVHCHHISQCKKCFHIAHIVKVIFLSQSGSTFFNQTVCLFSTLGIYGHIEVLFILVKIITS